MCFTPDVPKVPKPAPPPTQQSPEVVQARQRARQRAALMAGRASTVLTGPAGAAMSAATGYKTLLGS